MDSELEVAKARLGQTVGDRWLLERVLGTGGMGAVYAARAADGSVAAVKILHPEMGARRDVRERFLREGSAASKIGHPGVVQMLGEGDGDVAFLAMELLHGETLRERVRRHGRLPLEEVLDYAEQILDVLVAAHQRGVVHRDLKPDNLFVTLENRIKVLDFGLARLLDGVPGRNQTRTGVALGTLAYMAPEQALGRRKEIDGRVDVFALGATMFRVLSGRRVHEAESEAELLMAMASRPAPPLKSLAPELPDGVACIVDLALAFSRDARYPDAHTMRDDVRAARQGKTPSYATDRLTSRDERTRPDLPSYSQRPQPSQRTQPLGAIPAPGSQRTVPLAAYTEPTSAPAPVSTRTEPLAQVPSQPAHATGRPVPATAMMTSTAPATMPGAPAGVAIVPKRASRGLLAFFVVFGALAVASAGGLGAYLYLSPAHTDAAVTVLPPPLPPAAAAAPVLPVRPEATSAATTAAAGTPEHPAAKPRASGAVEPKAGSTATPSASASASATASPGPAPAPQPPPAPTTTTTGTATATVSAAPAPPAPTGGTIAPAALDAGAPGRLRRAHGQAPH